MKLCLDISLSFNPPKKQICDSNNIFCYPSIYQRVDSFYPQAGARGVIRKPGVEFHLCHLPALRSVASLGVRLLNGNNGNPKNSQRRKGRKAPFSTAAIIGAHHLGMHITNNEHDLCDEHFKHTPEKREFKEMEGHHDRR